MISGLVIIIFLVIWVVSSKQAEDAKIREQMTSTRRELALEAENRRLKRLAGE